MKNIVVVIGSPRKNGNTDILASSFIKGAKDAGNNVDVISVIGSNVAGCIGCDYCKRNDEHKCCQNDDMTDYYKRLANADVIVFATPIYFYNISSQLKAIIDRLHNPIRYTFKVKKLGLLAVCADKRDFVFGSTVQMYKDTLRYFSLEDGGIITVSGVGEKGDIIGNPLLEDAEKMGFSIGDGI